MGLEFDPKGGRAQNETAYPWLGDPERWGGEDDFTLSLGVGSTVSKRGRQLVRGRAEDLIARAWDLIVTWSLTGTAATDVVGAIHLLVTIGTGQASQIDTVLELSRAFAPLSSQVFQSAVIPGAAMFGTVQAIAPIPAVELSAAAFVTVTNPAPNAAHDVRFSVVCNISPRALA